MKFEDYKYERPNMDTTKKRFTDVLKRFNEAKNIDEQKKAIDEINAIRFDFRTMATLASIRHSLDTTDEFYEAEKAFFNQNGPLFSQLNNQFYAALVKSPFRDALEKEKGALLFKQAEQSLKTFSDKIVPQLQEENKLANEHQKLLASANIEFDGETYNLSQMSPFMQHRNRGVRKRANKAVMTFFAGHEETLDNLYDKLVKVRTDIAKTLGYPSFTELAYDRLGRLDYNADDVKSYRDQVAEYIVPINRELGKKRKARLGLETLYHYDGIDFKSGNAKPQGDKDFLLNEAKKMYRDLSEETDTFFSFMTERNLLDLEAKKGKAGGGYCTFIPNYDSPFIFANFNGTKHDVDVLTHEAGHAFQMFMSRHHDVPEYLMATMEASEIHSMSMEFFARPWADNFFGKDAEKYKFSHLSTALNLITYGVMIDEFQHAVYAKPDASALERKAMWQAVDKKYYPERIYDNEPYLENGNGWQSIMHIFAVPFYMIDYTLAQVCAFQYFTRSMQNKEAAWDSYVTLCKAGGSRSFVDLLKLAGLDNPFKDGTLKKVIPTITDALDAIDDSSL